MRANKWICPRCNGTGRVHVKSFGEWDRDACLDCHAGKPTPLLVPKSSEAKDKE